MLAGPVFTEWYWTPLFLIFVVLPPLAAVAGAVVYIAGKRASARGRELKSRVHLFVTVLVVLWSLLALGDRARTDMAFGRDMARAVPDIDFQVFEPGSPPDGLDPTRTAAFSNGGGAFVTFSFDGDASFVALIEQAAPEVAVEDEADGCRLSVSDLRGVGTTFYEGACELLKAPGGDVYVAADDTSGSRSAFQVRDGTLLHLLFTGVDHVALVDFLDEVQPTAAEDVGYFTTLDY